MNGKTRWVGIVLMAILLVVLAFGCAKPKVITHITSRGDKVKLMYAHDGFTKGVIVCDTQEDATLTNCVDKRINFKDE